MAVVVTAGVYTWAVVNNTKTKTQKQILPGTQKDNLLRISLELTFAGLDALKPPVISVSVAVTSTILIPSTARSTTTGSS